MRPSVRRAARSGGTRRPRAATRSILVPAAPWSSHIQDTWPDPATQGRRQAWLAAAPAFGLLQARGLDDDGDRVFEAVVDRKSTRLNSSHVRISYAVFCLKKKKRNGT